MKQNLQNFFTNLSIPLPWVVLIIGSVFGAGVFVNKWDNRFIAVENKANAAPDSSKVIYKQEYYKDKRNQDKFDSTLVSHKNI